MNSNASGIASSALASTDTNGGIGNLSNRFALDVQGFDAMRAQANASPQQGLQAAAKQFDAVFTQMMLKSMRDATPSDSPFDSNESKSFTSMLDQQLSQQMSSKGIGVADMMLKQLMRNAGTSDSGAGASGMAGGAGGDLNANAGNIAAMNAMAKAYASAAASKNNSLQSGAGYTANSALEPAARGNGSDKVNAFVDRLAVPAQAASAATGIPARFIIGQAALESGWGKREIKNSDGSTSHNIFGIKATKDWTGKTVNAVTTEYVNGQPKKVVERFRAYDSYEHALTDYASVLKNNPRYAPVVEASRDAAGFAHGMQKAGYATDPQYAKKLISIMRQIV
ncbi:MULTISPECIES: flagellar assembly peptidoglycan hydrolase FlgJ [unclassified Caballeronia]|uniref:flagellar assembly peptidoglycan hydrolase FlgJ n=1 Tax=unclassified Caballeronia TaxID=2646786 RepID=UPI0028559D23|nr:MULTISPECIES: flagellar assembly peptidoglycan hydrolase FlgJ [unclassified Caballeronia]MDR5752010.1 flagellar assembly peptidoglycan hydrolase FlgJ [Caballeronia sp. LZ024]MDR5843849.1 flagellar assembly peptidoglycan hydrolase FlgJ [Caballeronia sp. LZ031]